MVVAAAAASIYVLHIALTLDPCYASKVKATVEQTCAVVLGLARVLGRPYLGGHGVVRAPDELLLVCP